MTFRGLQDACESNPSLVNIRLKELRECGLVSHAEGGYRLTQQGRSLSAALDPLNKWAAQWNPGN